ncbi:MAG: hypothetical protein OXC11_07220 [Rhodospirillales bacterium]|nr:hypothetical protein [Rhodospirillales bacterium]
MDEGRILVRIVLTVCLALGSAAEPLTAAYADTQQTLQLFISATDPSRQGFVRIINHSAEAGEVAISAYDDTGRKYGGSVVLSVDAYETVHFNSEDLELGNAAKGLSHPTGFGEGDWRLELTSPLDVQALAYIRTPDGFLTSMHDVVPRSGTSHRVAIFNPGENTNQVSRLRLVSLGREARVRISGIDDDGNPSVSTVEAIVPAGGARTFTARQLESGEGDRAGGLGDGVGKWRLMVEADQPTLASSLLESPTGHLTNLSTAPLNRLNGGFVVPYFPAAPGGDGLQGFVRVTNQGSGEVEVGIRAFDDTGVEYGPLALSVGANQSVHFNSRDLERGAPGKGLSGNTGSGHGDWRLELESGEDLVVLAYSRTADGFLTAMHDTVPESDGRHVVAIFNPGSNRNQESRLRLINRDNEDAQVSIVGVDDQGGMPATQVQISVPARSARTVTAQRLENGGEGMRGALGNGAGKWQLTVTSDRPILVMNLLASPTGHLTNLSTAWDSDGHSIGWNERTSEGGL